MTKETKSTRSTQHHSKERKAAARALYEGDPNISLRGVAEETGIPFDTLEGWCWREKWRKPVEPMGERAQLAADNYTGKMSELGPEASAEDKAVAEVQAREQTAVDLRAQVLDRHRKEWAAPRQLSYEAVKARDFEKAKLAKITSETLKIIQDGERKAWGLDVAAEKAVTVVVERD